MTPEQQTEEAKRRARRMFEIVGEEGSRAIKQTVIDHDVDTPEFADKLAAVLAPYREKAEAEGALPVDADWDAMIGKFVQFWRDYPEIVTSMRTGEPPKSRTELLQEVLGREGFLAVCRVVLGYLDSPQYYDKMLEAFEPWRAQLENNKAVLPYNTSYEDAVRAFADSWRNEPDSRELAQKSLLAVTMGMMHDDDERVDGPYALQEPGDTSKPFMKSEGIDLREILGVDGQMALLQVGLNHAHTPEYTEELIKAFEPWREKLTAILNPGFTYEQALEYYGDAWQKQIPPELVGSASFHFVEVGPEVALPALSEVMGRDGMKRLGEIIKEYSDTPEYPARLREFLEGYSEPLKTITGVTVDEMMHFVLDEKGRAREPEEVMQMLAQSRPPRKRFADVLGEEAFAELIGKIENTVREKGDLREVVTNYLKPWEEQIREECLYPGDTMTKIVDEIVVHYDTAKEAAAVFAKQLEERESEHEALTLGQRVRVRDGEERQELGLGRIDKLATVYLLVHADGVVLSRPNAEEPIPEELVPVDAVLLKLEGNPRIVLDNGQTVYGCQVWWKPVPPEGVIREPSAN